MTYQITNFNGKQGDFDDDTTVRDFWQRSLGGVHAVDFEAGYQSGIADLSASSNAGHVALMAIEVSLRGPAWNAKLDGYNYATRDRGTNDEAPGFAERFDPAEPIEVHGRKLRYPGPFGAFRS